MGLSQSLWNYPCRLKIMLFQIVILKAQLRKSLSGVSFVKPVNWDSWDSETLQTVRDGRKGVLTNKTEIK
jgi:hypothetical protein